VPTIYAALLEAPIGDNDISSLEYAICGAAPMPALIEAFEAKTGLKIVEGYGLTEALASPASIRRRANAAPGRSACACHTSRCASSSSMTPGASCEWLMSTNRNDRHHRAQRAAGYLDPQQNADLWIDIEGSRWLSTGDLGRQDGLGYFWLAGRRRS
jgi:fatty-acyl-CoA synthase